MGTVGVLHHGWIHPDTAGWLAGLREQYPGRVQVIQAEGNQIPRQRNLVVEQAVGEWVLFLDADTVPPLGALEQLLDADQAMVGAVVLERYAPLGLGEQQPVAATVGDWMPSGYAPNVDNGNGTAPRKVVLRDLPRTGLVPVLTVGMACTLIRRGVFQTVASPWFRCGELIQDLLMEDAGFCLRARAAWVQPYLHAGVRAGHAFSAVLWPGAEGARWIQWGGSGVRERLTDQHHEAGVVPREVE